VVESAYGWCGDKSMRFLVTCQGHKNTTCLIFRSYRPIYKGRSTKRLRAAQRRFVTFRLPLAFAAVGSLLSSAALASSMEADGALPVTR
jgi:hypothetical protein